MRPAFDDISDAIQAASSPPPHQYTTKHSSGASQLAQLILAL